MVGLPEWSKGHVKAVMYSNAWVQTPQPTIKKYYSSDVAQRLACRAHNAEGRWFDLVRRYLWFLTAILNLAF